MVFVYIWMSKIIKCQVKQICFYKQNFDHPDSCNYSEGLKIFCQHKLKFSITASIKQMTNTQNKTNLFLNRQIKHQIANTGTEFLRDVNNCDSAKKKLNCKDLEKNVS